jgi:glycosyltransferase involved in cell wall biosynthesis
MYQSQPSTINLWAPDIFEFKGGIQVYSAFFLEAIQTVLPQCHLNVFLKHDRAANSTLTINPNTHFHFSGRWTPRFRTAAFAATIATAGFTQRPDLILSTHPNFTQVAYWLKQVAGIPYWTVVHGIDAWNIENLQLQRSLHHADCILAVSNYTRDRLLKEQNLDPKKIVVLPNTFNSEQFQIADKPVNLLHKYNLGLEQPVILTVARLSRSEQYKGYDKILMSLPQIRQAIPNVHYILVGKGDDKSRIQQLIIDCQLEDCVTLAGFVPDEQLAAHYHLCDVFAMPSKGEGFGIVYLEALACGKPTLGGNQDGAIDALCQGELGALVNPDSISEISQALIQILQGTYPNDLIYQQSILRQKVIQTYGFERFKQTLGSLLS